MSGRFRLCIFSLGHHVYVNMRPSLALNRPEPPRNVRTPNLYDPNIQEFSYPESWSSISICPPKNVIRNKSHLASLGAMYLHDKFCSFCRQLFRLVLHPLLITPLQEGQLHWCILFLGSPFTRLQSCVDTVGLSHRGNVRVPGFSSA